MAEVYIKYEINDKSDCSLCSSNVFGLGICVAFCRPIRFSISDHCTPCQTCKDFLASMPSAGDATPDVTDRERKEADALYAKEVNRQELEQKYKGFFPENKNNT
jgi:hypothetical protein